LQPIDLLKKLTPPKIKQLLKPLLPRGTKDADGYVYTDDVSGALQFELLKRQGCSPDSKVLEIGCGNLHAGKWLIEYLARGNYVGVDPNEWLRRTAMKDRHVRHLVKEKQARFLSVDNFDASELGIRFDYVLSHSILSHCAHWQLELDLRNAGKVLAPVGRILASIRLAEGNAYGSSGTPDKEDSKDETWQYPGVSWFKLSTVLRTAEEQGLSAVHIPEYTEFYTKTRPTEYHDWLVFTKFAGKV
jgi:cyclopropane fatty-acyl-phospholipid synthase-like methyltransferase